MADNEQVEIVLKGRFENGQLVLDTVKNIEKGLKNVGDQAENTEKKSSSLTSTLKKLAAIVGITAVVNQFKNLTKGSLEAAGAMEQVDIALTTMLGSGEKAKKLTADLIDFAKKTPFEIEGIFSSTKQLLAYGVAQEDIISTMGTLGNIAAGVGVDMNRLALAFGQVKTTGRLMGQDLNQFTQAGVPLLSALAGVLGKTEAEVLKLKESGAISFDAVKAALESLTSEGGRFYNLMENQSKTFLGTVSNMSDGFYQVKVALGEALLPVAKDVVNSMIDWFGTLKTKIEENKTTITAVASAFVSALKLLIVPFQLLGSLISAFSTGASSIGGKFILFLTAGAASTYGLIIAVKNFTVVLTTLRTAFATLTAVMLANPFVAILAGVVALITAGGYLIQNWDVISSAAERLWLNVSLAFEKMKQAVIDAITVIVDKLQALADFPGFGWVEDAKKKVEEWKDETVKSIDEIENKLKNLSDVKTEVATPDIAAGNVAPATQNVQQNLLAPEDPEKAEQKRLKALKEENDAMLEEQKNFLAGYGMNETEADKLIADNKTLSLQNQILASEEYQSRISELQQQQVEGEITNQQYLQELENLNNEAKNEALTAQYEAERELYMENQALMNEIKLEMQATQDEAELAQLQMKLNAAALKEQQSLATLSQYKTQMTTQTFEQKKKAEEDSLKHTLKMDSDGFKAAQGAANELVALQNSKHKELAAIGKAAAIFQITVKTAEGAISAYSSLAPIPIVGPALGAAAAAAVIAYGAEQLSTATSASFAVGTPNIPSDQLANVHKGEMIIPATFAEAIRSGDLTLGASGDLGANPEQGATITNININFEGAQFVGQLSDEDIASLGERLGQLIAEDVIVAIPTRRAA